MAKTAKLKHDPTSNPRSRASKRQTSPSINTDKSLKDISIPTPIVLAPCPNAGVRKPKNRRLRGNAKSSKQKKREERKLEKAEAVMDRMEVKVEVAGRRVRRRKERKEGWEGVNGETKRQRRERLGLGVGEEDGFEDVDVDEDDGGEGEMEDVEEDGGEEETFVTALEGLSPVVNRKKGKEDGVEEMDEVDKIT